MQITAVNFSYKPYVNTFKSNDVSHFNENGELTCRNSTCMFRNDILWQRFAKALEKNFEEQEHVNVYDFACSDGSEAYTLAISLMEYLPDGVAEKFFPIIAKDIDGNIIDKANSGFVDFLNPQDYDVMRRSRIKSEKYFENSRHAYKKLYRNSAVENVYTSMKVKENLRNKVEFSVGDIFSDIKNLNETKPCVILLRNVIPYFLPCERQKLFEGLDKCLPSKSIIVFGEFDFQAYELRDWLEKGNFKELNNFTYQKI